MSTRERDAAVPGRFHGLGTWAVRYRLWVLLTMATLTGALGHAAIGLRIDSSSEAMYASTSQVARALSQLRERFGRDDLFLVLCAGDVFSEPFLLRLRDLHRELASVDVGSFQQTPRTPTLRSPADPEFAEFVDDEGWGVEAGGTSVDEITSLINIRQTRSIGGTLRIDGLMDEWPAKDELDSFRARVLADRNVADYVLDRAGTLAIVALRTTPMDELQSARFYERLVEIKAKHQAPRFDLHLAGVPSMNATMNHIMQRDANMTLAACLAVMIVLLTVLFRHPLAVVAPVIVVIGSVIWTVGLMALCGAPMTLVTNVVPAFLICVGIGDSVHVLSVYRQARHGGLTASTAVAQAVGTTGLPIVLTSATTAVGLLSFSAATLHAIRDMGIYGAFGVMAACVHSLLTLPALISFHRRGSFGLPREARNDGVARLTGWLLRLSRPSGSRPSPATRVLLAAVVLCALGLWGSTKLSIAHDPLTYFPDEHPTRRAFELMDQRMQGATSISILLDADRYAVTDHEALRALERFRRHVEAYDEGASAELVGRQVSLLDAVHETNRALHDNDPAFYRTPDDSRGISDCLTMFESAGPDELRRVLTIDRSSALLTIRVRYMEAGAYAPLTEHLRDGIRDHLDGVLHARITGTVYNEFVVANAMQTDLFRSLGLAVLLISACLALLLRSLKLTLIAMAPNLVPVVLMLGFMGATGIPLDVSTLLLGSIMLGIAVDDTIHFMHQVRRVLQAGGGLEQALEQAMGHAGRAMVGTSAVLACGFSVFGLAVLSNVQLFGVLIAIMVVVALLFDLIVLPALLRLTYGLECDTRADADNSSAEVRSATRAR